MKKINPKDEFIDNTQHGCWGLNPEPENHDAFVGWRTIYDYNYKTGKPRLDYVPGRGSSRGLKADCDRLVKWWSKGRNAPEKQFLKCSILTFASFREECKQGIITAYAKRSSDYAYISLYLDYLANEKGKEDKHVDVRQK